MHRDVSSRVRECVHCSKQNTESLQRQAKMITWHPLRRFKIVAIDVFEVSTTDETSIVNSAFMGDLFTRCVWAVSIPDESLLALARVLLD